MPLLIDRCPPSKNEAVKVQTVEELEVRNAASHGLVYVKRAVMVCKSLEKSWVNSDIL